jgi:hypothetical protein
MFGLWTLFKSIRLPLEQRKSVGILEDLDPIGNFPFEGLWNKGLNSYQSYEIPKGCLVP